MNSKTTIKPPPKTPQGGPKPSQDRPKRAQKPPRAAQDPSQDDPRPPQERSGNGLGAILEPSKNMIENKTVRVQFGQTFWVDFGAQNDAKNDPKTTQNESKFKTKNASFFYRSWTRLRPVLRRFWVDLEALLGSILVIFHWKT